MSKNIITEMIPPMFTFDEVDGITRVHINDGRCLHYVHILINENNELLLDVYTNGNKEKNSLGILDDRGRIRPEKLGKVLSIVYRYYYRDC